MYVSDQKVSNALAIMILAAGPAFGVSRNLWGWMLEIVLLLAVFRVGQSQGFKFTALLLCIGYGLGFWVGGGWPSLEVMTFVPWAGLIPAWGQERAWARNTRFFWGLVAAAILGALPMILMLYHGLDTVFVQELTRSTMEQYRQSGMLEALTQQGLSEAEIQAYMKQALQYAVLFIPSFGSLSAILQYSLISFFFARWFSQDGQSQPFIVWRLPWYAIWGANLGIASYLIGTQGNWQSLRIFGMNVMLIYAVLALILGSSIFLFYLRSPFMSRLMKTILIFISFLYFQVTVVSLILLGIFDLVLNFRRLPGDSL